MAEGSQDVNAAITWTDDWSAHLAANGNLTITAAVVTADSGAVVSNMVAAASSVTFKLTTAAVAAPADVTVTVTVTLSNGDTDVRRHAITVSTG